jgi:hypothetical protein
VLGLGKPRENIYFNNHRQEIRNLNSSPNVITEIVSRRSSRCAGHAASMEEMNSEFRFFG